VPATPPLPGGVRAGGRPPAGGQGGDELQKHSIKYPLKWGEGNCRQFLDPKSLAYVALVLHSYSIV
jgi:hypothetical protein